MLTADIRTIIANGNAEEVNELLCWSIPMLEVQLGRRGLKGQFDYYSGYIAEVFLRNYHAFDLVHYTYDQCLYLVVREALKNAKADERTIRLSRDSITLVGKIIEERKRQEKACGEYDDELVAERVGVELGKMYDLLDTYFLDDIDAPCGGSDDDRILGDTIASGDAFFTDELSEEFAYCKRLLEKKGKFTEREWEDCKAFFGIGREQEDDINYEQLAHERGYKSAPAMRHHVFKVVNALNADPQTYQLLSAHLG